MRVNARRGPQVISSTLARVATRQWGERTEPRSHGPGGARCPAAVHRLCGDRRRGPSGDARDCGGDDPPEAGAGAGGGAAPLDGRRGRVGVYPRRRGEHDSYPPFPFRPAGSSPQARGTLAELLEGHGCLRFIPAGAGNTTRSNRCKWKLTVHPRRRGEHDCSVFDRYVFAGSSPQARGTRGKGTVLRYTQRFIPAGAGNTSPADRA